MELGKKPVYITEEGKADLLHEIVVLEMECQSIMKQMGEYLRENPIKEGFADSVAHGFKTRIEMKKNELQRKKEKLNTAIEVERLDNINKVQLGDLIRVSLSYDGFLDSTEILEVTSRVEVEKEMMYEQVSDTSPIGASILGKEIGTKVSFEVPSNEICEVEILEILQGLKNNPKQKQKTLTR